MAVTYTKLNSFTRNPNGQSAHALSSWTQIIATTAATYQALRVIVQQSTSNGGRIAFSLSTGGSGSESSNTIVDDFFCISSSALSSDFIIPIEVTSGTRLSLAFRCNNANTATIRFTVYGITATAGEIPTGVTAIRPFNYDNTTTLATSVLAGDSGSTIKGAYNEMTSSLSADIAGLGVAAITNNLTSTNLFLIDVATGAAASESVILPDIPAQRVSGQDQYFATRFYPYPVSSGTRIAARVQADTTTVTVRDIWCVVYAYYGAFPASSGGGAGRLVGTGGLV